MTTELPRLSLAAQALAVRQEAPLCPAEPRSSPLIPISYVRGRAWFVALASPVAMRWTGEHFPAERAIEELRFETYVPRETRKVVRRGRRVDRISALLGGYIFVRFDRERDEWGEIRAPDYVHGGGVEGVHGILKDMLGLPRRVPDIQVERLRRLESGGAFDFSSGKSAFTPGDDVQITEGPFAGFLAKVRSASPQKRVKLILQALGDAEIEPEFLERVSGRAKNKGIIYLT